MKRILFAALALSIFLYPLRLTVRAEPAKSYVLMEGRTSTLLYAENGNAVVPAHHSAKLMTLLLAMEKISSGGLSMDGTVKVSAHANSMPSPQIWLSAGEEVPITDLIKAITVGNANDACTALAEAVGGSEPDFVALMNKKALDLGMSGTKYADCTGLSPESVTTASDCAILASALLAYDNILTPYFTTWVDAVRSGRTEVASQNRLILTYSGITGMKAYYTEALGYCVIATAERGDLKMVCVLFGEEDEFGRFTKAKEKLNAGFSAYTLYKPGPSELFSEPVKISGGELSFADTEIADRSGFIIRKSQQDKLTSETVYFDDIEAPVEAGQEVGRLIYRIDGEEICSLRITAKQSVKRINFFIALKRIFAFLGDI